MNAVQILYLGKYNSDVSLPNHILIYSNYPEYLFIHINCFRFHITDLDFGDGNTSTNPNPVHVYLEEDTYLACLTVFDSCGESFSLRFSYVYPYWRNIRKILFPYRSGSSIQDWNPECDIVALGFRRWFNFHGERSVAWIRDYGEYKINLTVRNSNLQNSILPAIKTSST